jgi:pimeloyl-ACP methyl ester carboxylesterase
MTRTIADLGHEVAGRYPYTSRFVTVNGWRMHYIDEDPVDEDPAGEGPNGGDPTGLPPVLLLHGNPTWGYLWRDVVPVLLAAGHRVVVPDQIGLGLSEHPHADSAHGLEHHAANLVALIDHLDLRNALFVCHDWGGPTGLSALLTRPERVAGVAIMSTWAWRQPTSAFHQRILPWGFMHAPLTGPYLLGRHGAMPGRGIYLSVVDRERYRREAQQAYEMVLPDPDDRRLTWQWPRNIPLGRPSDRDIERFEWLESRVRRLELPATIIWGREDDVFEPETFIARWLELWPHAEGPHMVTGRHFLQEDSGPEIGRLLVEFARRALRSAVPGERP